MVYIHDEHCEDGYEPSPAADRFAMQVWLVSVAVMAAGIVWAYVVHKVKGGQ